MTPASSRRAVALPWLILLASACGPDRSPGADAGRETRVGGEVAATVDGEPIRASDIRAEMARAGGTPREALSRLESRLLLFHEAQRLGLGAGRSAATVERRALVQRVLLDVEREVPASSITDEDVRRAFDESHGRLDRPERRRCSHLLFRPKREGDASGGEAARGLAETALAEAARSPDPVEFLRSRSDAPDADPRVSIVYEELPAFDRAAPVDSGFLAALFEPTSPGLVPRLVPMAGGFLILFVSDIEPAVTATLETHGDVVRQDLLDARRFRAVSDLVERSKTRFGVELREATIRRLLGDDALFERMR